MCACVLRGDRHSNEGEQVILNKAVKREYDNGMGTDWSALLSFLDDLDVKEAVASSRDETKFV